MQPQYITLPKQAKDVTGQRFGRLVALGPSGQSRSDQIMWHCQCDCGNTKSVIQSSLANGKTVSCGCLRKEIAGQLRATHGMSGTSIHRRWKSMIQRCTNPAFAKYPSYGARGIKVCDEWRSSFQAFYNHVSLLPHFGEKGYSLDRIDNNGDYKPDNVRWATSKEQGLNIRSNHTITFDGKTQTLGEWAIEFQINSDTLASRLLRGWSAERALATPPRKLSRAQQLAP